MTRKGRLRIYIFLYIFAINKNLFCITDKHVRLMRRKIHSLTFMFMALLMMLMTFASCSKLQDLLNEGDDDDDDDGGIIHRNS